MYKFKVHTKSKKIPLHLDDDSDLDSSVSGKMSLENPLDFPLPEAFYILEKEDLGKINAGEKIKRTIQITKTIEISKFD